jgi:pRiA4b ORF-3-like protein
MQGRRNRAVLPKCGCVGDLVATCGVRSVRAAADGRCSRCEHSFWLDGSFFGDNEVERTTPDMPDAGAATADVPIADLALSVGQRIGYVFDFGDDWRVRLTVRERTAAEAGDHPRVLARRGTPPPQYAAIDD